MASASKVKARKKPKKTSPAAGARRVAGVPHATRRREREGSPPPAARRVAGVDATGQRARAALYLRVSTRDQAADNQRPDLEALAAQRRLEIVRVYEETASGAAAERRQFTTMLDDAHRGRFDVLLVWAIDRFGRSMVRNVQAVLDLDRCHVRVISYREPWLDLEGPVRQLLIAVFSWVAEQERAQLVARTIAGMQHARDKGIHVGRPRSRVDTGAARAALVAGLSLADVARRQGVGRSTLVRALKTPGA